MEDNLPRIVIDTNVIISALVFGGNSKIIIEKLIAREIEKDIKDRAMAGSSQYIQLQIPECSADDKYVIVGKAVKKEKVEDKTGCSCGNGYCGAGEDQLTCPTDCARFFREENLCKPAIAATALFGLIALAAISIMIYYAVQQESLQRRLRKALFWLEILFILLFAFNLLTCGIKAGIFLIEIFAIIILFVYMYKHKKALGSALSNFAAYERKEEAVTTADQATLPAADKLNNSASGAINKHEEKRQQGLIAEQDAELAKLQITLAKHQELLAKQQQKKLIEEERQQLIRKREEFDRQKKAIAFIQKQKELRQKASEKYPKKNREEIRETPATFAYRLLSQALTPFNRYDHHLDWIYDVLEKAYVAYNSGKKEEARKFYVRASEIYELLPFDKKIKVYYALRKLRELVY